jgi:hypothetical protein
MRDVIRWNDQNTTQRKCLIGEQCWRFWNTDGAQTQTLARLSTSWCLHQIDWSDPANAPDFQATRNKTYLQVQAILKERQVCPGVSALQPSQPSSGHADDELRHPACVVILSGTLSLLEGFFSYSKLFWLDPPRS